LGGVVAVLPEQEITPHSHIILIDYEWDS